MKVRILTSISFVMIFMFLANIVTYASNPSDCSSIDVKCVKDQFGLSTINKAIDPWTPEKGAVLFYGESRIFTAYLYFDGTAKTFYENNPWAGFEIDINFQGINNYTIPRIDPDSVAGPSGTDPLRDTIIGDWSTATRGITVTHPSSLKEGWNVFSFQLKDDFFVDLGNNVPIKANIQLVANVASSSFINTLTERNDFSWVAEWLYRWIVIGEIGNVGSLRGEVFRYFTMDNFQQALSGDNPVNITSSDQWQGLCWNSSDPDISAKECDSSNFVALMNASSQPQDNSQKQNLEGFIGPVLNTGGGYNPPNPEASETDPGQTSGDYGKVTMSTPSSSSSKPELYVKELKFKDEKTKYYDDETGHAYATAKNVGIDAPDTDIKIKLFRFKGETENGDTKEVGSENIRGTNLKSGDTKQEEFDFSIPDDEGVYPYYAVIDTSGAVSEANENNNRLGNIRLRVHHRPDIHVSELTLDDGRAQFDQQEFVKGKVTVTNTGGEPFIDVPVHWYLDGKHIGDDNMRHWNIENGDEKHEDIYVLIPIVIGTHTFKACAELDADRDQRDNCKQITFQVVESSPAPSSQMSLIAPVDFKIVE